jgi:hypothetical protein
MIAFLFAAMLAGARPPAPTTGTNVPKNETAAPVDRVGSPPQGSAADREPTDSALKSARTMAGCVLKYRPAEVQGLLASENLQAFQSSFKRFKYVVEHCLGAAADADVSTISLSFGTDTMMGVLAEALLLRAPMPALQAVPLASAPNIGWVRDDRAGQVVLNLASCLAATQPASVAAVLATRPDSPQEAASFSALAPAIGPCLERNVTLHTKRAPLRVYMALAFYRRTLDPLPQPSQAAGSE